MSGKAIIVLAATMGAVVACALRLNDYLFSHNHFWAANLVLGTAGVVLMIVLGVVVYKISRSVKR
ncbi:MAG: hypothetical protein V3R87_00290 [Dehalococcoidia bacterium]